MIFCIHYSSYSRQHLGDKRRSNVSVDARWRPDTPPQSPPQHHHPTSTTTFHPPPITPYPACLFRPESAERFFGGAGNRSWSPKCGPTHRSLSKDAHPCVLLHHILIPKYTNDAWHVHTMPSKRCKTITFLSHAIETWLDVSRRGPSSE